MDRLKLAIPLICCVMMAAHFLRERSLVFVLLSVLGIPFLFFKWTWAVRGMQLFFTLAGIEWLHTTIVLVRERKAMGLPWIRMTIILSVVTALTLASAKIVRRPFWNVREPWRMCGFCAVFCRFVLHASGFEMTRGIGLSWRDTSRPTRRPISPTESVRSAWRSFIRKSTSK